jgi:outer membrane protease
MLGVAKEFVYQSGYTVSELDWPLLPVFYAGIRADFGETAGFLASVELQVGIPSNAGSMTDSDFLNGDGVKTHFSEADGDLENAVVLTAQAGWGIPFETPGGGVWSLEPFLEFEFIRLEWTAQNGYLQYPPETSLPFTPWSPSTPQTPVYGTGIIYSQTYAIPAFGLRSTFPLMEGVTMTLSFTFSPYLWCSDQDTHLLRQLEFYDSMHGGVLLEPRLSAAYRVSSRATLSFDVLYRHIASLIGDEYAVGISGSSQTSELAPGQQSATTANGGGASLDVVNMSVTLEISL